jgi:hypothetical protein
MLDLTEIEAKIEHFQVENELTKKVQRAFVAGICPECGKKLIIPNLKKTHHFFKLIKWVSFCRSSTIKCPDDHNIDFNLRTSTKPEYAGYDDLDMSRIGNGNWYNTQNVRIKDAFLKLMDFISD